jgi:hypothetical protein
MLEVSFTYLEMLASGHGDEDEKLTLRRTSLTRISLPDPAQKSSSTRVSLLVSRVPIFQRVVFVY